MSRPQNSEHINTPLNNRADGGAATDGNLRQFSRFGTDQSFPQIVSQAVSYVSSLAPTHEATAAVEPLLARFAPGQRVAALLCIAAALDDQYWAQIHTLYEHAIRSCRRIPTKVTDTLMR